MKAIPAAQAAATESGAELWVRRCQHTAWRRLGDETVIVDLRGHRMFGLDEPAARLWRALETALPRHRLDPRQAAFIDQLMTFRLVEEISAAGAEPDPPPRFAGQPTILWHEELRQAAATCAFLPGQNVLCNQVPFS